MGEQRAFKNDFPEYSGVLLIGEDKRRETYQKPLLSGIKKLLKILEKNAPSGGNDYTIYTGTAGQALLHLHLHETLPGVKDDSHLKKAFAWLEPCLSRLKGHKVSFPHGDAGPLSLAAVILRRLGDKRQSQECISRVESMCHDACRDTSVPDEILFGRSGYLSALLFLQHHLGDDCVNTEAIVNIVNAILKSGEEMARKQKCSHPLMYEWHDKAYLGAAHGLAGIYFTLLQVQEPSLQERIHQLVRPCIDFMLTLRFASGNCPSSLGSSSGDKLVHWCHGAPGWVHMFALAYRTFKDKRYLEAARDCGKVVWKRGLLYKGYGICHGTAGNAYTFLTLFKLTGEQRYLYYAYKFAEWCCDYGKHGCRTPDRPFSMFEGMAGTVYFLADMLNPLDSKFPAFEY